MSDAIAQASQFMTTDGLLALLISGLLVSVLINLAFVQRVSRNKKKKLTNLQTTEIIRKFIGNQIIQTQNASRHQRRKNIDKSVLRLREAYLSIERACLDLGIDSDPYWRTLAVKLKVLLGIYDRHKSKRIVEEIREKAISIRGLLDKAAPCKAKDKVMVALNKLEAACENAAHDPDRLVGLNDKLGMLLQKFGNEFYLNAAHVSTAHNNYLESCKEPVEKIKNSTDSMTSIIDDMRSYNEEGYRETIDSISDSTEAMRERIYELESQLNGSKHRMSVHTTSLEVASTDTDIKKVSGDIHDLSDEIIEASEREIDRLNKLVKEKKIIIRNLEDALRQNQTSTDSGAGGSEDVKYDLPPNLQKEVELLRRNLNESEQCIVLLEGELEILKKTRSDASSNKNVVTEEAVSHLNNTVDSLKKELMAYESAWREKDLLFGFIQECVDANTAEDISLSIYQCLNDMGFDAELLVYTPARTMEVNETGALRAKDKMLINNMQVNESNLSDYGKRIFFRLSNIGGAVCRKNNKAISTKESSNLMEFFSLTQKMLSKVNSSVANLQQKRTLDSLANSVKYIAKEVDDALEEVLRNADSVVRDGFGQVQDVARSAGMPAGQIANIRLLEKSMGDELKSNARTKLRLRKSMLSLLQQIEKLDK